MTVARRETFGRAGSVMHRRAVVASTVTAVQQADVVVRKLPGSDGQVRTGVLLARQGPSLTVRWDDDGREEDVRISTTTTFAVRGSVRHQGLVDRAALIARLETEPVAVVLQLLRDHESGMTAVQIKEKFTDLGLDRELVDKVWKRVQSKLAKLDRVRFATMSYRWIGPKPEVREAQAGPPRDPSADGVTAPAGREAPEPQRSPADASLTASEKTTSASQQPRRIAPLADLSPGEAATQSAADKPVSLALALAAALGDRPVPDASHYAARPLATAARLHRLDDAVLDRLVTSVGAQEQARVIALLAALPRSAKPVDAVRVTAVDPVLIQSLMAASAAELRERSPVDPEVMSAVRWLLRRVIALPLDVQAVPSLIELAAAIAADPGKGDLATLDRIAQLLHRQLPVMKKDERDVVDLDAVSRIASKLSFTPQGGRAALLSAVGLVWPERVTDEIWWRDATLTDLADCATGFLGPVTSRPEVAKCVIAPRMTRELSRVTSRVRLAKLLTLPAEFVEHLAPEGVANAFRRVGGNDPVVESWVQMLAGESRVAQLRVEVERAQDEARRANERAERAEASDRELAARYERLEKLLQQQHEQSVGIRASQERQLQIDAIRSLAELAAEVEELAASDATQEVLVERVRSCVSEHHLEPVGEVGIKTVFNRELHEALIGAPGNGEVVTVLRPGYRWRSGDEDILLSRALVRLPQP
jgi:hypothetical protein